MAPDADKPDNTRMTPTFSPIPATAPYQTLDPLAPLLDGLSGWPDQAGYDALLARARAAGIQLPGSLRFVSDLEPVAYYESHIGATGEVPTRSRNWHDWFGALSWLAWPRAKVELNARHVRAIGRGEVQRGPLRDAATLLDECGVLVATSRPELLDALSGMDWRALFVDARAAWGKEIEVRVLGHAVFEQALTPHRLWCAKALPVTVDAGYFALTDAQRTARLDAALAAALGDDAWLTRPRELAPLPLLGIPGWDDANRDAAYYDDTAYFCRTRRAKSASVMLESVVENGANTSSTSRATSSSASPPR